MEHKILKPDKLIFVVDDEPDILELVTLHLQKAGFQVREFQEAEPFLEVINSQTPELIILDLMLPDMDGLEICKYIRKEKKLSSIPIIMLTARTEEMDRILGLELGADDYVTKPFSPKELVARVKAVLRRKGEREKGEKISVGDILIIDPQKFEVYVEGKRVELTSTEFRILNILMERRGWVFSREQLLNHLWGKEKIVVDRTIDVHIKHLREKLGKAAKFIKNIRGIGYKLEE